jgi:cell division protein FtsW
MINWSKKNFQENGFMQGDWVLWMIFIVLCCFSIVVVYSASSNMTYSSGKYWAPIMRHGSFILLGVGFTWIMHILPCKLYKLLGLGLMLLAHILLICALFTGKINGAARWVGIGDITFQPSEFAKLGLVMTTAFIFSVFRDKNGVNTFGLRIALVNMAFALLLIVTENLSTAVLIGTVMFCMCFYAQVSKKFLLWVLGGVVALGLAGYLTLISIPENTLNDWKKNSSGILHRVPTWVNRVTGSEERPEDPKKYDINNNMQVGHAHIAIATGGLTGLGPGNSVERDYLPQAFSDFIYAILIEEWGLGIGFVVMFLYILLLIRSYYIARKCESLFPAYLIMGLSLMLVVQALINMAVAVGAMPVTGQPLPLISRGGTSTFVNCAYFGIMLSVSRSARKIEEKHEPQKEEATE